MKTIKLEIEDSAVDKVIRLLEQVKDVVKIKSIQSSLSNDEIDLRNDPLAQELQRRIKAIDGGTEILTPYKEGMDAMMERIKAKYASA